MVVGHPATTNSTEIAGRDVGVQVAQAGDVGRFLRATATYTDSHASGKTAHATTSAVGASSRTPTPSGGGHNTGMRRRDRFCSQRLPLWCGRVLSHSRESSWRALSTIVVASSAGSQQCRDGSQAASPCSA